MILYVTLYIQRNENSTMRNRQLLSVVFSLVLVTGVSANAFADSDDLEDKIEDFCEFSDQQKEDFFSDYPTMANYESELDSICQIADEDEREEALEDFADEMVPQTRDDDEDQTDDDSYDDKENDYDNDRNDDKDDDRYDDDKDDQRYEDDDKSDLDDVLEPYCEMNPNERTIFFDEYPELLEFEDRLDSFCQLDEDEREDKIEELIDENFADDKSDYDKKHDDLEDRLEDYCEMNPNQKALFFDDHPRMEQFKDRIESFCSIADKDQREETIEDFVDSMYETKSEFKESHKDLVKEMQDKQKDITDQKREYEKLCKMTPEEREMAVSDPEKLDKVSEWCEMSPEERKEFNKEHHDVAMEFKEKRHDLLKKIKEDKDMSPRIKDMIMQKSHDSDKSHQEIKAKYAEKYGKDPDKVKMAVKEKFKDHKSEIKFRFAALTDQQKSDIMDRYKQMKEFKTEIQQSDLTQEQRQELRAQFIEDAKNIQLAWITPRDQVSAGIEPDMIECREGFSLVMKTSNGLPMCVKTASALTMIERGIVVPAN